jgi:proteic killer suppression protein
VIRSFANKDTERLFNDKFVRAFPGIERAARRKLLLLDAVGRLDDLREAARQPA